MLPGADKARQEAIMKKLPLLLSLFAGLLTVSAVTCAGTQNDVPSCYAANNINSLATPPSRELFVLIDQTTVLDDSLRQLVRENVSQFAKPGNAFVIADFSAFSQGKYTEILNAGTLESPIAEKARNTIGVNVLKNFDACFRDQGNFAAKLMASAINKAMQNSSDELAKSDVLYSIKDMSARVRQSLAKEKIVFIVSDMLENSSITSFYAARNVRNIDPAKEMVAVDKSGQIGDFAGARVFVLGAGIVPEDKGKKVYRDPKTMTSLKHFWNEYFMKSKAQLVEFGAPALLSPIK